MKSNQHSLYHLIHLSASEGVSTANYFCLRGFFFLTKLLGHAPIRLDNYVITVENTPQRTSFM